MEDVMNKVLAAFLSIISVAGLAPASPSQVAAAVSVNGGAGGFYFSVGSYFRVPEAEVLVVRDRYRLADEEIPVVFLLARHARVTPAAVIALRVGGLGWFDIALQYHLNPEIFFVPVGLERIGPPFGRAYGFYRNSRRTHAWGKAVLSNREVVDLVNLKFISEHHGIAPESVMAMRANGQGFIAIHGEASKRKGGAVRPVDQNSGKGKTKAGHRK
jgi:hypothetical protein